MSNTTSAAPDGAEPIDSVARRGLLRLEQSFQNERIAGLRLATTLGLIASLAIALFLLVVSPPPWLYGYELGVGLFALSVVAHYRIQRRMPTEDWVSYLFVAIILIVVSLSMALPVLILESAWPTQMFLRNNTSIYFFVMIAMFSLTYSPGLTLWAGAVSVVCWITIVVVLGNPSVETTQLQVSPEMSIEEVLAIFLDPQFVAVDVHLQDIVIILLVTAIMATSVARSRRLVWREALAERERGNLARYFPPQIVDRLSQSDEPLASVRAQEIAILFADIVGFTPLAERQTPEQIIALLREFHSRLEQAVFTNGGTLDKFLGDGVMATFGTPDPGPRDTVNALEAAQAMHRSIDDWNRQRERAGAPTIRLSIGLHYGPAVLGDIGSERRLEFAVLGDAVNVASRLEGLTRSLDAQIVASDSLIEAARRQGSSTDKSLIESFQRAEAQEIRGRRDKVAVWVSRVAADVPHTET